MNKKLEKLAFSLCIPFSVWSVLILIFSIKGINDQINTLDQEYKSNYEDLKTQIESFSPIDNILSDAVEISTGHYVTNVEHNGVMQTGVIIDLSAINVDELLIGRN